MDENIVTWIIIPLLIILARLLDVPIGVVRIIFVGRGKILASTLLAFFESLIWVIAISQVMQNLNNIATYIGFALGFALGNYVGVVLGQRFAFGLQIVRVITQNKLKILQMALRDEGFGATTVDAFGGKSFVNIVFVVAKRKYIPTIVEIIKKVEPESFFTIQDVQAHHLGYIKREAFLSDVFIRK